MGVLIVFVTAFLGLAGCASSGPTAATGAAPEKAAIGSPGPALPRVIDAHAHFEEDGPSARMYAEFAENNIVGAVVHASRKRGEPKVHGNSPVKFAVCAAAVPGHSVASVEKGLKNGTYHCIKIYLAYVPKWAYDPFYTPYYKLAEKYDVPVVFHTGDPYDKMAKVKYADPLTTDEVAVTYPKVRFVIAHLGNPWIQSAAEVVYKNDNMYADTSALMLGDVATVSPESVEELLVKPIRWFWLYVEDPKKLMFGTDWPLLSIRPYLEAVKRAIPKEHWDDVFYGNATRVFRHLAKNVASGKDYSGSRSP